jgi:hypothetical protein
MAARKDPRNRDSSNKLASATQLLNRLISHGNGEIEMTPTQIQAAKIVIGKYIPDLKAIELTGKDGGAVQINVSAIEASVL